jgi:anion-transporting  ArsA/GET3 family ATPase
MNFPTLKRGGVVKSSVAAQLATCLASNNVNREVVSVKTAGSEILSSTSDPLKLVTVELIYNK